MTDISKCRGEGCPIKESCYRFTAPNGYWQSYSDFKYEDGKCEFYWEVER